jgi:hypothetical protein
LLIKRSCSINRIDDDSNTLEGVYLQASLRLINSTK